MGEAVEARIQNIAEKVQDKLSHKVGDWRWAFLMRGILAIALGFSALFWPEKTMGWLTKLLGAYFIFDTFAGIFSLWRAQDKKVTSLFIQTVVSLCLGVSLLFFTGISAKVFLSIVGIWMCLQGVSLYLQSRELKESDGAGTLIASVGGVVGVIGLVFIFWQETSVVILSYLLGLSLLAVGALLLYVAKQLKRLWLKLEGVEF